MPVDQKLTEEFIKGNLISDNLNNIHLYVFAISFAKISALESAQYKRAIADLCVKELVVKLQSLNLFGFDKIEVGELSDSKEDVRVSYRDDMYHFTISVGSTFFGFQKSDSTLIDFLTTCDLFFDFFLDLYQKIKKFIEGAGANILFIPYRTAHVFKFTLENFKPKVRGHSKTVSNYELMERIIPSLKLTNSPIGKMGYDTRGRMDIKISGLIQSKTINWVSWIVIEAPGNRNYSTMQLNLSFNNEVNDLPDGSREPFNEKSISEWRSVFLELLKEKACNGFLQDWLIDVSFESVRQ